MLREPEPVKCPWATCVYYASTCPYRAHATRWRRALLRLATR